MSQYWKEYLIESLNQLIAANDNIDKQIVELEAQKAQNEDSIEEIEGILNYIDAGSPSIPKLDAPDEFLISAEADGGVYTVELSWGAVADAEDYKVYRSIYTDFSDPIEVAATTGGANSFIDTVPSPGLTYYYRVVATAAGYATSDPGSVSIFVEEQLSPVMDLGLVAEEGDVLISWSPTPFADNYDIFRGDSDNFGDASLLANSTPTNYTDETATPGQNWWYWVVAKSATMLPSDPVGAGPVIP